MREDFEGVPSARGTVISDVAPDFDAERYAPLVSGFDMTEAQRIELLQSLFIIVHGFVELGFTGNICEQIFGDSENASSLLAGRVKSLVNGEENGRQS